MSERKSLWEFLSVKENGFDITIDEKQIQLLRKDCPSNVTNDVLKNVAEKFHLCTDDETLQLLSDCLNEDDQTVIDTIKDRYIEKQDVRKITGHKAKKSVGTEGRTTAKKQVNNKNIKSTELSEIRCIVEKLKNHKQIDEFIKDFFLNDISPTDAQSKSPYAGTILDEFVRNTLRARGTIDRTNEFELVEPESFIDAFDTDAFDHLRGLFQIHIRPKDGEKTFPSKWQLKDDALIDYEIVQDTATTLQRHANQKTKSVKHASSLIKERALSQFLLEVEKTTINKGSAQEWEGGLKEQGITDYEDLERLDEHDWQRLKSPSLMVCKLIKMHLERQRHTGKTTENKDAETMTDCEVLANLHMIKLYMLSKLKEYSIKDLPKLPKLPKLESKCVELAFEEMRKDMEDDGLFDRMSEFFYPLTVTEEELVINDSEWAQFIAVQKVQKKELEEALSKLKEKHEKQQDKCQQVKLQIDQTEKQREEACNNLNNLKNTRSYELIPDLEIEWSDKDLSLHKQLRLLRKEYANEDTLLKNIEDERTGKEELLKAVKNDLNRPVKEKQVMDSRLCKPHRGFIMYGPPGTGKSQIMKELAKKVGIAMLGPPLASGELDRPLVGQSEKVILDLCSRGHRLAHLMCCVCIDEIDALAPRRDEDASEGRVARISVLLSVLEGIKDVPNLMFFSATNRLHMMDEAFLRRMTGKFFVGRPTYQARKNLLKKIPPTLITSEILDELAQATTNFSGAALNALNKAITVHHINARRGKPHFRFDLHVALETADEIAEQYQLFIGGQDTLPRLLLTNLNQRDQQGHYFHLKSDLRYTGKIIVSLIDRVVRVEIGGREVTAEEISLHSHERNLSNLLERLTNYGNNRNVQLLQLIDLSLLASRGAYEERKVFETLKERYDEHMQYDRSMIVYDLDSLIGVNRSESNSSMGLSHNCALVNQGVYTQVVSRFRMAQVDLKREKWAVAVVRDSFLLKMFSSDVDFPRTKKQLEEDDEEHRKDTEEVKCFKCDGTYLESENKMGACDHHDGFIYDNSLPNLPQYTPSTACRMLLIEEYQPIESDDVLEDDDQGNTTLMTKEKAEQQKGRFRYACCNAQLQIGMRGGCKKGKHGGKQAKDLKTWEKTCMNNREALHRWYELLKQQKEQLTFLP